MHLQPFFCICLPLHSIFEGKNITNTEIVSSFSPYNCNHVIYIVANPMLANAFTVTARNLKSSMEYETCYKNHTNALQGDMPVVKSQPHPGATFKASLDLDIDLTSRSTSGYTRTLLASIPRAPSPGVSTRGLRGGSYKFKLKAMKVGLGGGLFKFKLSLTKVPRAKHILGHCHVHASTSNSSIRTQAAAAALHVKQQEQSRKAKQKHERRVAKKKYLMATSSQKIVLTSGTTPMSDADLESLSPIVFCGSLPGETSIEPPAGVKWHKVFVCFGPLTHVLREEDNVGIHYPAKHGYCTPDLFMPPRADSLSMTSCMEQERTNALCDSLQAALDTNRGKYRGASKTIFGSKHMVFMGVKASRGAKGCTPHSYHHQELSASHWDNIFDYVVNLEAVFMKYAPTQILGQLNECKKMVSYVPMSNHDGSDHTKYFPSVAIGCNAFMPAHTDQDFTLSVCSVHIRDTDYKNFCEPITNFCFPRLGVCIAMYPGDILVFNPLEPHAISSRCRKSDNVYALTTYLKTAVVGGNNNSVPVTTEQKNAAEFLKSCD